MSVDLSSYRPSGFQRGRSAIVEAIWMVVSCLCFRPSIAVGNRWKAVILRMFGARVGTNVVLKPGLRIKFPWKLSIADHVWLGESVWIDNLDDVTIESHACISQEAMLVCGNHDYTTTTFDLMTRPIVIERGAWVATRAVIGPGVRVGTHAVVTAGSVATKSLDAYGIYRGNPAERIGTRAIRG